MPDETGRLEVIRIHTKNMKLDDNVDLEAIAGCGCHGCALRSDSCDNMHLADERRAGTCWRVHRCCLGQPTHALLRLLGLYPSQSMRAGAVVALFDVDSVLDLQGWSWHAMRAGKIACLCHSTLLAMTCSCGRCTVPIFCMPLCSF